MINAPSLPSAPGASDRAPSTEGGGGAGPLPLRESPPLLLPGAHFALALVFLIAACAGLVVVAPDLAAGRFLVPRVAATTHLLTLGWITTSVMGALYQLLPVVLGAAVWSRGVAYGTLVLHGLGLTLFVTGLAAGAGPLLLPGAGLLAAGLLLFLLNVAPALARARARDLTWWCIAGASLFLLVTLAMGALLAVNLRAPLLGPERLTVIATHAHIALGGWVLLIVIGVARRLAPMFLLTHIPGERVLRIAAALVAAGALGLTLLHHVVPMPLWPAVALLLWSGAATFLLQARRWYAHRHRRQVDPGMRLAGGGLVLLGGALLVAPAALALGPSAPRLSTAYGALLVLAFSLFVAGHYYKIVPFLVWFHRFGPLAGTRPLPTVAQLYDRRHAAAAGALLTAGALALAGATALGIAAAARAGALLLLGGALVAAAQMTSLFRTRPS